MEYRGLVVTTPSAQAWTSELGEREIQSCQFSAPPRLKSTIHAMNLARSVYSLWRVPASHNLVRVAVIPASPLPAPPVFDSLLTSLLPSAFHSTDATEIEDAPTSALYRKALYLITDRHISNHHNSPVPVPNWSSLSREPTQLDMFLATSTSTSHDRTNAALVLHDVHSDCTDAVSDVLSSLPANIPTTLAGVVPDRDVALGPFGLNQANYHAWQARHAELSSKHPSVYGSTFVSPNIWGGSFHSLYVAQASVLYPKHRLAGEQFEGVCDTIAPVWDGEAAARFGEIAYGRALREEEAEQLLTAASLKELLQGLAAVGKSDVAWAWLRAHGYDGRFNT